MDHSPYLDRPLLPLAVALPRMLEKIGVELTTAGPDEARAIVPRHRIRVADEHGATIALEGLHHDGVPRLLPCFFRLLIGGRSCTGARSATSHGTSVAADLPGCWSSPGAQNTGIRGRLPAGQPGPASLQCRPANNRFKGYRDSNPRSPVGRTGQAARMSDPQEEKWRRRIGQAEWSSKA
jgi:hypothetical protein